MKIKKLVWFAAVIVFVVITSLRGMETKEFDLVGKDFRFFPDTLIVTEGDTVVINFENPDQVPHLIDLPDFNTHVGLPPGGEISLEFVADKVGAFDFVCSVPGHQEAGMVGKLIVQSKK